MPFYSAVYCILNFCGCLDPWKVILKQFLGLDFIQFTKHMTQQNGLNPCKSTCTHSCFLPEPSRTQHNNARPSESSECGIYQLCKHRLQWEETLQHGDLLIHKGSLASCAGPKVVTDMLKLLQSSSFTISFKNEMHQVILPPLQIIDEALKNAMLSDQWDFGLVRAHLPTGWKISAPVPFLFELSQKIFCSKK